MGKKNLTFGKRYGFEPIDMPFQEKYISHTLRIELWNAYYIYIYHPLESSNYNQSEYRTFHCLIWINFFKKPIDDFPSHDSELTEGKATGFPLIKDEMKKNGNPKPIFYTDEERTLFLVTLPCHPYFKVTKSVSKLVAKSGAKISREEIDKIFAKDVDFKVIGQLLNNNIIDVKDYVRKQLVSKSVSKSIEIIDFLKHEKRRIEILTHIQMSNHSKNYDTYLKPLIDCGIIEQTIPDKPNSKNQKYRLTAKGKKLLK